MDQCELIEDRFTLIAPDDYRHDLLEIKLWSARGRELARESLYEGEEEEEDWGAFRRIEEPGEGSVGTNRWAVPVDPSDCGETAE